MIYLYTGTPGSGKSCHTMKDIIFKLQHGGNVIANFPVDISKIKKVTGKFVFMPDKDLTVKFLKDFARENHKKGKESQTLLIFDEAQSTFNSREYQRSDRKDWNMFFSLHRHIGYNVILITQNDRLLDRQIRCLVEYEIKHRKINNFKFGSLLPFKIFACIQYWYGAREKMGVEFFRYKKFYSKLYDSYALFDVLDDKDKKEDDKKLDEMRKKALKLAYKNTNSEEVENESSDCSDDGFGGEGVPGSGTEQTEDIKNVV
jgi:zona occludens toxin